VKLGGPLLAGDQPKGSFFLLEVGDAEQARRIAEGDPFDSEGLFERIEVKPLRVTLGGWRPAEPN
jgi:uncharacterized protein YciI